MTQAVQALPNPVAQWVTFRLDRETYGINVMQVQEVLRVSEITPVPGSPEFVLGIINLRGHVVTVVDARRRFNLPALQTGDESRIVITETGGQVVGMLVDSVAEVLELRADQIEMPPTVGNEEKGRFVQGVCSRDGELLILVDLNQLLGEVAIHGAGA